MNYRWANANPNPDTICAACAELIGTVWEVDAAPLPPVHPGCFCLVVPTSEPVNHPGDVSELSEDAQKHWLYHVVFLLRQGLPLPVFLLPLREAAEKYIQDHPQEGLMPETNEERVSLTGSVVPLPGKRYEVTFIEAGQNKNGWVMPVEVLGRRLALFEGVPCLLNHADMWIGPDVEKWAATHQDAVLSDDAVKTTLRIANTPAGRVLESIFDAWLADREAGLAVAPVGISADLSVQWAERNNPDDPRVCADILKVWSGDTVLFPAAGGKVERVLNSLVGGRMSKLEGIQAPAAEVAAPVLPQTESAPAKSVPSENDAVLAQLSAQIGALTAEVQQLRQAQTDAVASAVIDNPPAAGIHGMRSSLDQVEVALTALLSGTRPPADVHPLTGIREAYVLLSGDYEMTGMFHADRVSLAAVSAATMPNLVANVLNKVVVNRFNLYPRWWESAVTEQDFGSLQQIRWITLGGVGELPTVPAGQAYAELTWGDLAQRADFVKKGGYLGITLEAIDKDDTQQVVAAPGALAQAGWLTLGKAIAGIATANSNVGPNIYYDASNQRALFHASNGNLGNSALSLASWRATKIAMMKLGETNSGERLGAVLRPRLLWVPIDLEDLGLETLASEGKPGTDFNDVNVDAEGETRETRLRNARNRLVVCPFWTNTANWMAQADPALYPSIGIGYRYGRTPEIFSVASPTAGLMFTNDVLPVKVRFFFATGPMDYRGLYKHNV